MNTLMYEHPLTAEHIRIVKEVLRYEVVGPIGKVLACGDIGECEPKCWRIHACWCVLGLGMGAMTEWKDIVAIVIERFQLKALANNPNQE